MRPVWMIVSWLTLAAGLVVTLYVMGQMSNQFWKPPVWFLPFDAVMLTISFVAFLLAGASEGEK